MKPPETRYARSGDLRIAYQVVGSRPFDLVFVRGFISNLDHVWQDAGWSHFFSRLAAFSRLILFDKRGTGLSDRVAGIATLEERMDDVRAVLDAVGSERVALFGLSEGGPMSLLFAATYPRSALVRWYSTAPTRVIQPCAATFSRRASSWSTAHGAQANSPQDLWCRARLPMKPLGAPSPAMSSWVPLLPL